MLLALTHRSWCAENPGEASNERLEFLGDAVLGLVVTDHIFTRHPEMPEGSLAKLRAAVVSAPTLAAVAAELGVGDALRLGKGEDASGGRAKASILADAMEAVIGAVYVDGGLDAARRLVLDLLGRPHRLARSPDRAVPVAPTTRPSSRSSSPAGFESAPVYEVVDEGPDHEKRFYATVRVDDAVVGRGEGRSKKLAEQAAAGAALEHLATDGARTAPPVPVPGNGVADAAPDHTNAINESEQDHA